MRLLGRDVAMLSSVLLAGALAAGSLSAQKAADLSGRWKGFIDIPEHAEAMEITLARVDTAWSATLTVAEEGAQDVPFTKVVVQADSVLLTLENVPGTPTFRGAILENGSIIAGQAVHQERGSAPFRLTRAPAVPAAPAAAPPATPRS